MPKRPVTPPPADDEPRYLTVVHPYPLHASMERESDRRAFVYWMATCIGKDDLYAFFHKPKSPNMVIIEVNRDFQGLQRVLGEHRWAEVLRNPSEEEKSKVSKVFFCKYRSGREVEKNGWKRVFIQDNWYETPEGMARWRAINDITVHPYPQTYRCEVPVEDRTREPLCRPLPVRDFPPPPPTRPLTVGSVAYYKSKTETKVPGNAWASGVPLSLRSSSPAASGSTMTARTSDGTGVSLGVSNMNAWSQNTMGYSPGPTLPPGLLIPPAVNVSRSPDGSAANSLASSPGDDWHVPPGLVRTSSKVSSSGESEEIVEPASASEGSSVVIVEDLADAMQGLLTNDGMPVAFEEQEAIPDGIEVDLWAEDPVVAPATPDETVWRCPTHFELCKRKLCTEYGAWARAQNRLKQQADREAKANKPGSNGKWRTGGRGPDTDSSSANKPGSWRSNTGRTRGVPPAKRGPIPARPAQLQPRPTANASSSRASPITSSAPACSANSVPPRPAHLARRPPSPPSREALPSPPPAAPTHTIPPKPARFNKKPAAASPAPVQTPPRPASGGSNQAEGQRGVPAAPWSANVGRPTSPGAVSDWGSVSEGPWGNDGHAPAASMRGKAPMQAPRQAPRAGAGNVWAMSPQYGIAGPSRGAPAPRPTSPGSVSEWGAVSEGPWGSNEDRGYDMEEPGMRTPPAGRSWADEMDAVDTMDARSEADEWDAVSAGPW
ncbi:uncharacterized protein FIBRA_05126 [Fibroporia radiculosa]|uniref:Uncharacterized protein n=1 Tax=Fibroporia radiculosa TaxID=599839 RepID=J4H3C0_9APHY|nr:uncharacterized protein FIBRA_05126 [Fibroporia radiculosa]CCM03009.1 predicted protein [Fibroporia radiculosa]